MINVKYRPKKRIPDQWIENIKNTILDNLELEKKYHIDDCICIYKIEDFLINENKAFFINFYCERTKFYDFKQTFLSKLLIKNDQTIYLMEGVGYVFITDLLVKSFPYFWSDIYAPLFPEEFFEMVYKNF